MSVVVVEHQRAHVEVLGGLDRDGEADERPPLVLKVIGHEERRVAEGLGLSCPCAPGSAVGSAGRDHREAERVRHRSGVVPATNRMSV